MASDESETLVQEIDGEYQHGKAAFVKGVRMPHVFAYQTGFKDFLENFETRQDDVFIIGFPRSGTTWLQEITWQIFNDGAISKEPIGHRVQFFDEAKFPHTTQPDITTRPSPRLMKTHLPFHAVPKGTSDASRCKYIYVARTPHDVVVSYYLFDLKMAPLTGYSGPFEYFADMFIKGTTYWGSWTEHVLDSWKHKDDANVLFLTYEDLKENLPSQIRLIAKFVGKSLTEETMERIAKQCTFNEMKKNASAYWMMTRDGELPNYLRRGQIGGWKDSFTPELTARFESEVLSKLEGTGLQFGSGQ
ncbi:hypothetical protein OS493_017347 [Desmophyllum pertusum]|uniref:Sulfotransferase domain-containing protein n=1 Tax=Desmophyllum pertusum TaxID=174260 RepID=A0A9X0D9D5_9CNID|nr:hypothetical protein OS493_017347 [Desmophyllum pertusum]